MKCEIRQEFDLWFQQNGTHSKKPKITEVNDYMDKRFGKYKARGWVGTAIKPDIAQEEEEEEADCETGEIEDYTRIIDNVKKVVAVEYSGDGECKM
jgi:hypothetical protein